MKSYFESTGANTLYAFEDGNVFVRLSDAEAYKKLTKQDFKTVEKEQTKPEKKK